MRQGEQMKRYGRHRLVALVVLAVSAVPAGLYIVVVSGDPMVHESTARSVGTIVQVWIATGVLIWLAAWAADHEWPGEKLGRAAIRMAVPVVILGLVAGYVANRSMFGPDDRFYLVLFPVLIVVVAAAAMALRSFLSVDRSPVPPPPTPMSVRGGVTSAPSVDVVDRHLTWSRSVAGLCVCASPIIWFVSVLCNSDEVLNALLVAAWAIVSVAANLGAGWLLDRYLKDDGGFLLVLGRVLLSAFAILVVTSPILGALTSDPNGSC